MLAVVLGLAGAGVLWASVPASVPAPARSQQVRVPELQDACRTTNPYLVTSCFNVQMDPNRPMSVANAVVAFRDTPDDMPQHVLARWQDTGAVWGLAYAHAESALYAGAFHKRYTSFGPGGPGAVYRVDLAASRVTTAITVPNAGPDYHEATLPGDDERARDWAGKTSLGDLDVDSTGSELFVVNLADRRIYRFAVADGRPLGSFRHGAADEPWSQDARPFGLKMHDGRLYHGVVHSAETSQRREDLEARVYSSLPDGTDMRLETSFALDYPRGFARVSGLIWAAPIEDVAIEWLPWRDAYNHLAPDRAGQAVYPQPIVADIEFDEQGQMVVGLRDRQLDMTLAEQIIIDGRIEKPGFGAGDVVRVPRDSGRWGPADVEHYYGRTSLADASALGGLAQMLLSDHVSAATVALHRAPGTRIVTGRSTWYENPMGNRVAHEDIRCGQFSLPDPVVAGALAAPVLQVGPSARRVPGPDHNEWSPAADLGDIEVLCGDAPTPTPTSTGTPSPTETVTPTASWSPSPTVPAPSATPPPSATAVPSRIYLPIAVRQRLCDAHADVVLVLDVSTSMRRSTTGGRTKVAAAVDAARQFTRLLSLEPNEIGSHDQVAVVGFNDRAWIVTELTNDRRAVDDALDAVPEGMQEGTRLDLAFEVGQEAASSPSARPENEAVMIVLTDGLPNRVPVGPGGSQEETVLAAADRAKRADTTVFTIGLGRPDDINADLLSRAATQPEMYYYAPDGEDLAAIYRSIAGQLPCPGVDPWPPRADDLEQRKAARRPLRRLARPDEGARRTSSSAIRSAPRPVVQHGSASPLGDVAARDSAPDAATVRELALVAEIGGAASSVAIDGRVLFAGVGGRVLVFDVSRAAAMQVLATTERFTDGVLDLHAGNGRLLAIGGRGALHLFDVTDPAAPARMASLDLPGAPRRLFVEDELVYVACDGAGLAIVDVGDAAAPRVVSRLTTRLAVRDVVVRQGIAYVADSDPWESGVRSVDVSDPAAPRELGFEYTPGGADSIALEDEYAYVMGLTGVLWVVDVADPARPRRNGVYGEVPPVGPSLPASGQAAFDVVVIEDYAYVAHGDSGLDVVDLRFPGRPLRVGTLDTPGSARAVTARGRLNADVFIADWSHGIRAIDASDEGSPVEVGSYEVPGTPADLHGLGTTLLAAERGSTFRALDLVDPLQPELLGLGTLDGTPTAGLLLGDGDDGSAPRVLVGERPAREYVRQGNRYIVRLRGGLSLHLLRPPGLPKELATIDGVHVTDVRSDGTRAYVSTGSVSAPSSVNPPEATVSGLHVYDLSPRHELDLIGETELPGIGSAVSLDTDRGLAFVASTTQYSTALHTVDVSRPEAPVHRAELRFDAQGEAIAAAGDRLLVAAAPAPWTGLDTDTGLLVIDASEPEQLQVVGSLDLEGGALDVAALGDELAVVADGTGAVVLAEARGTGATRVLHRYVHAGGAVPCHVVAPGGDRRVYAGCEPSTILVFDVVERVVTPTPTPTRTPTMTPTSTAPATATPTVTPSPPTGLFLPRTSR